jgi:superfamily II DNA or RNA helicase
MELEKLDLKNHLIRMGMPTLQEIIGVEELKAISKITNKSINETMIADLLIKSGGTEIFSDGWLRGWVIRFLPDNYKSYLEYGDKNKKISDETEKKLIDRAWNRNFHSHYRLIEIFNLTNEYLPDYILEEISSKILQPNEKLKEKNFLLSIFKKILNFIKSFFYKIEKENFGLENFQIRIKNQILNSIYQDKLKAIIHMPTGSGKTKTILSSLIDYNSKSRFLDDNFFIWLAHSDELCDQAKDTFENLWNLYGDKELPAIRLKDQSLNDIKNFNRGIIICTYAKLHKMRMNNNGSKILEFIRSKSKFIIADEAHMVPANTFKSSIEFITKLDFSILIGLTATPGGYYTEQTQELAEYFEKNKISITDNDFNDLDGDEAINFLQKEGVLSVIKTHQIKTDFNFEFNDLEKQKILSSFDEGLSPELIKQMEKDEERNICIYGELQSLYERDMNTIVFACSLDHTKLLHKICILTGMNVGKIDDKTSYKKRKQLIGAYKSGQIKIIFNYGVLSTGFDAPGTKAILITRPTTSPILYSQMIGRGLRGPKFKGNKECLLIDMKDNLIGLPDEKDCFSLYNKYYSN